MQIKLALGGLFVLLLGIGCIVIDQWMNFEAIMEQVSSVFSPMVWTIPVAGGITAVAFTVFLYQLRVKNYFLAALIMLAFVGFTTFSATLTLERVVGGLEQKKTAIQSGNKAIQLAQTAYNDAVKYRDMILQDRKAECKTGYGRRCTALGAQLSEAELKVSAAQTTLVKQGSIRESDPMAASLAEMLPFLSKWFIETYRPALLPLCLLIGQIAFFAAGLDMISRSFGSPPVKEGQNGVKTELPLVVKVQMAYEENPKATVREIAESLGKSPSTISRARQKLQLVK